MYRLNKYNNGSDVYLFNFKNKKRIQMVEHYNKIWKFKVFSF